MCNLSGSKDTNFFFGPTKKIVRNKMKFRFENVSFFFFSFLLSNGLTFPPVRFTASVSREKIESPAWEIVSPSYGGSFGQVSEPNEKPDREFLMVSIASTRCVISIIVVNSYKVFFFFLFSFHLIESKLASCACNLDSPNTSRGW